ncbi:MAG: signal recognition particle protein [Proteobacteria bacterium]|nr:signal recognition particle protein [Cystobacterineae bacterium]MCL2258900.1 signal recognition particle protein [Cystobacterineae bacterium]MCL2314739.1 signal recognition particle protein [Pseudomonadota bacterium]
MLETVTKGFRSAKNRLQGKSEITEALVEESLRDIRISLLEADVAFGVVKTFVARVREKAVGEVVSVSLTDKRGKKRKVTPVDHFIKICHDELEALMGPVDTSLSFKPKGQLTGIMMVGLQGSGKTTTAGKLAKRLSDEGKKPLLVAADIYRPAAVEQLKILGEGLGIPVFHEASTAPPELASKAWAFAKKEKLDVVIVDTAGRLAIDETLMQELETIKATVELDNILLVCDAMIGQDAVRTAAEFDKRLSIDGFILTKLDGDARGGAALSIKEVTGKPIKFLGMGETMDRLEEFRPDGLAGRILGFGDIVGLMKDFEAVVDEQKAEEDAQKLLSGKFDMRDFVEQIRTIRKMGPLKSLLDKFPIFGDLSEQINPDEKELERIVTLFNSMTEAERKNPTLINDSRALRIAKGSGQKKQDVLGLLQKFQVMQQVMGGIGKNPGLLGRLPGFKQLGQLSQLKNMDLGSLLGGDKKTMPPFMGGGEFEAPKIAPGISAPMNSSALARARLMGYAPEAQNKTQNTQSRDAIKERRKREKTNKKKNRKKR